MELFPENDLNYKNSTPIPKWYPPKKINGKIILTLRPEFVKKKSKKSKKYKESVSELRSSTSKSM